MEAAIEAVAKALFECDYSHPWDKAHETEKSKYRARAMSAITTSRHFERAMDAEDTVRTIEGFIRQYPVDNPRWVRAILRHQKALEEFKQYAAKYNRRAIRKSNPRPST